MRVLKQRANSNADIQVLLPGHQKNTRTTSRTMSRMEFENTKEDRQQRRDTNESFSIQRSVTETDSSENDDSEIATSVQNSSLCIEKLRLDEAPETSRDKERAYEEKHMQDNFIFNRKDQTNPEAYIIYAFLNGHGTECQHVSFAKKQLKKGFNYVLELIARCYNIRPGRLVCMDGKYVRDVNDLMSRGAYVIIPTGQKFRETWYFLPDFAIDTSTTGEEIHKTKTDL
ncbi:hypothetical protein Ddc_05586 [Ditylenchus destructor]|nr:hypothetical protein Ddc_05586 [Ditylenchus destructor]